MNEGKERFEKWLAEQLKNVSEMERIKNAYAETSGEEMRKESYKMAKRIYPIFQGFMDAGFSEHQAMTLLSYILAGAMAMAMKGDEP